MTSCPDGLWGVEGRSWTLRRKRGQILMIHFGRKFDVLVSAVRVRIMGHNMK